MKRISILLFFIALMMPPCHEPGTSMAQDATECLDTFPQQCGESVQLARLTLPMVGVSVPAEAPAGCTTVVMEQTAQNDSTDVCKADGYRFVGQRDMTPAANKTICAVAIYVSGHGGDLTGHTYNVRIAEMNGTSINFTTLNSTYAISDSMTGADLHALIPGLIKFTFSTPFAIITEKTYAYVITQNETDSTNYITIRDNSSSVISGNMGTFAADGTTGNSWGSADFTFTTYEAD